MSLYAALDIASGKVIGSLHARHRAIEFKKFLQKIDQEVPDEFDVHLVIDNASTHKTPAIKMAGRAPALRRALHSDIKLVAQSRRTLVRRTDQQEAATRIASLGASTQQRHQVMDRNVEREPTTIRLDQDRRRHPRIHRTILHTN